MFEADAGAGGASETTQAPLAESQKATATAQAPESAPQAGPAPDAATLKRDLEAAQRELARHKSELGRREAAERAAKDAAMSETERLQSRIKELEDRDTAREAQRKADALRMSAITSASRLGFADVEDAVRFLDADRVEWKDDGSPRNVERLLGEVLASKPYLKASFTKAPDLGQGDRGGSTLTIADIKAMSQEEVTRRLPEIEQVLAASNAK